jgi:hypothetical protein
LAAILALPPNVVPVASQCLDYVDAFPPSRNCRRQEGCRGCPPTAVLRFETWDVRPAAAGDDLRRAAQPPEGPGPERERE